LNLVQAYEFADCFVVAQRQLLSISQHASQATVIACAEYGHAVASELTTWHNDRPTESCLTNTCIASTSRRRTNVNNCLCFYCGKRSQARDLFSAEETICHTCGKMGHFACICNFGRRIESVTSANTVGLADGQMSRESLVKTEQLLITNHCIARSRVCCR